MEKVITNPNGALRGPITSYITGRAADGFDIAMEEEVELYRANATITVGQALAIVAPTATAPVSVTPLTTAIAAVPSRIWGVAKEAGAAGDLIKVMRRGIAVVNHDTSDTPAAYDFLLAPDATTGAFATASAAAAGVVVCGLVLGAEIGTENKCLAYFGFVPVLTAVDT